MNDVGISVEFINYGTPWVANYCTLVDSGSSPYILEEEDLTQDIELEDTGSGYINLESINSISSLNLPYYGVPYFVFIPPTSASYDSSSYSVTLQQSDYDFTTIREGLFVNSNVMFNPDIECKNVDDTYKRIVFNQVKNSYYDFNPITTIGSNNQFDVMLDGKNQVIYSSIKSVNIPQPFFGESIIQNSIAIRENRGLVDYTIVDDGNGNLYTKDKMFSVVIDDQNRGEFSTFPTASETTSSISESSCRFYTRRLNMGYSVAASDEYAAIGSPCFEKHIPTEGFVDIYNYDKTVSDKFSYLMTLKHTPDIAYPVYDILIETNTDFGRSVDVCGKACAISVITAKYYFTSSFGIDVYSSSAVPAIEIYDLSTTSSLPSTIVSASMVPSIYDTGSGTFGQKISINNNFLVVGCPYSYKNPNTLKFGGSVYVFSGSINTGYSFHSMLTGSNPGTDILFGRDLKIDKTYNRIIVGNGNFDQAISSNAYLFEYVSGSWKEIYTFSSPPKTTENLNFIGVQPYSTELDLPDAFGTSVSIYCASYNDYTVAIGAPFDRVVTEYSGSSCYKNGAVYLFDRQYCTLTGSGSIISYVDDGFVQNRVSGNDETFKNNKFGHSVDLHDNKLVVSSPKYLQELPADYFSGTFMENNLLVHPRLEEAYLGMFHIYIKTETYVPPSMSNNSGSVLNFAWSDYATYKPRKLYGHPHCFYAYDVAIFNDNLVVGNPIVLVNSTSGSSAPYDISLENTIVDVQVDKTVFVKNLQGNFNIFTFSDYESEHHVGNVFYKTGRMVLSTSGSIFDSIFETYVNDFPIYDIEFKNKIRLYEKEIICTVNPGEFNYSTNPTAYTYSIVSPLDLNKTGKFEFDDCDKVLRGLYYKFTGTEAWWKLFDGFSDMSNFDTAIENSLFNYYISNSPTKTLLTSRLTPNEISYIVNDLNKVLDINGDGVSDYNDIKLVWKYFVSHLSPNNFNQYQTSRCISGNRPTYDMVTSYLDVVTGKSNKPTILDTFYSGSTSATSSYLTPYVTTIGLYNGADLIATAKLGTPTKNLGYFPINFIVRFDM